MPQFPTRWPITKDECDALDRAFGPLPMPRAPDAPYYSSDEALERAIERLVDRADALFLAGRATQEQYDAWMRELNRWSETKRSASADRDFGQAERLEDNSRHPASAQNDRRTGRDGQLARPVERHGHSDLAGVRRE